MPPTAQLMDGTALSRKLSVDTALRVERLTTRSGRPPCLAVVLAGGDSSSVTYVRMKQARCRDVGIESRLVHLPTETRTAEVVSMIRNLSLDAAVDGIFLQYPLPHHVDQRAAFEAISPEKDVDGVTMHSFAAMAFDLPGFAPCTPAAIIRLLDTYGVDIEDSMPW